MTKAKISEYDAVAANNTDVNGVNIAENCPPSGMNNMGREIMAALKRFQTGSDSDGVTVGGNLVVSGTSTLSTTSISSADINAGTIDGTAIGGSTAAAGSFTTLNTSGAVVFNDAGADVDFRVEGDTDANLLFVDASADAVGIGTNSPTQRLEIRTATDKITQFLSGTGTAVQWQTINDAKTANVPLIISTSETQFLTGGAERMRIDSSGNLLVGTTSSVGSERLNVTQAIGNHNARIINNSASGNIYGPLFNFSAQAPNDATSIFLVCSDNAAARAMIYSNGGIANYQGNDANLSDRREKTNFAPAKNYLDTICAIPVQTFNYVDQNLEEDDGLTLGVVAQDVQEVAPELVMESNWGTEEEPKMRLSIYQTDLQYALMKCIQELKAELDTVKAELATLKG